MSLRLDHSTAGKLLIRDDVRVWIEGISFSISAPTERARFTTTRWTGNAATASQRLRRASEEVAVAAVGADGDVVTIQLDLRTDLDDLSCADSFEQSRLALPALHLPPDLSYFLVTYGLGGADDPLGGYWPAAKTGTVGQGLPHRAFAPIVLFDEHGALAIAPASQFLTSVLLRTEGGIARGLHGSVDRLTTQTRIETILARGKDVADALLRLGDVLLARGGKRRPVADASPLTSGLGWWNAYGGFYTEPIRPLDERHLVEMGDDLHRREVPVKYLGIDLWYPYRRIGQAVRFSPDRRKYPSGLGAVAERLGLSTVLHLSARAPDNDYGSDGGDPTAYGEIGAELVRQGAIAAWHDWLRTQQHLAPRLRNDPRAADQWFEGLARLLGGNGLNLLLCMQTMGMALASTGLPNAISARSAIDYLFGQPEAFDTLDRLGQTGFRAEALPVVELWRQNLLVGFALYAFGLLPFYDLFLSAHHPGLGGTTARIDALLRALSCGPVGIGDGPGRTDVALVRSLLDATGRILRPDHPPIPDSSTLGAPVEVYRTRRAAGGACWEYLLFLNTSQAPQRSRIPGAASGRLLWDLLGRRVVTDDRLDLAPGGLACVLAAPRHAGIAILGLADKLVPAARDVLRAAEKLPDGWRLDLHAPGQRMAIWSPSHVAVRDGGGAHLTTRCNGDLVTVGIGPDTVSLEITRR